MQFQQLKTQIKKWELYVKKSIPEIPQSTAHPREDHKKQADANPGIKYSQKVVGGDILWKPINYSAALLIAKAPWWAHPPVEKKSALLPPAKTKTPRKHKPMRPEIQTPPERNAISLQQDYVAQSGLHIKMVNGEPMFRVDELQRLVIMEIERLHKETSPMVKQAKDARQIVAELLDGIGGSMEKFQADVKGYLNEIRQARYAVVTETASIVNPLREIRQFFLDSDYKDQVARLKEFVELCERLQKLKESGFLDTIADTMLQLAVDGKK